MKRLVVALLLVLALPLSALGARFDDLVRQLKDRDYKVRLSAALSLGKLGDRRAVPALITALGDDNKSVRGVAAAALGKIVDEEVDADTRKRAMRELKRVADRDPDAFVRSQAKKAYDQVASLEDTPAPSKGGVYVEVGPMSDNTKKGGEALRTYMRDTVSKTIQKSGNGFQTEWSGGGAGKTPTAKQLSAAGFKVAFYVDGSLKSMDIDKRGSQATVSCQVSLVVATYPDKSMFGFADGGAAVETSSRDKDVEEAKRDCVGAVLESLVSTKVLPVIVVRAR